MQSKLGLAAIQFVSEQPQELVRFYEDLLGVKFKKYNYPNDLYIAHHEYLSYVIHDRRSMADTDCSETSLTFVKPDPSSALGQQRLCAGRLGTCWPNRYAAKGKDPDGNRLAFLHPVVSYPDPPRVVMQKIWDSVRLFCAMLLSVVWEYSNRAIDLIEHLTNTVSYVRRDLGGFTHFVASRQGLFVVNKGSYKKIMRGQFFGMTFRNGDVYCFQANGTFTGGKYRGRVLKLTIHNSRIKKVKIAIKGLDDACHQIDFVGDDLLIVDCRNASIVRARPDAKERGYEKTHFYPLGKLDVATAFDKIHLNSLAAFSEEEIWLLAHNKSNKSEIIVVNQEFEIKRRITLDACWAHDIVFTGEGDDYVVSDSYGGRLVDEQRVYVDIDSMLLRGISLDDTFCVIGNSYFTTRILRRYVPGNVIFVRRKDWKTEHTLTLPAAPTLIRRIDGEDYGVSNYRLGHQKRSRPASQNTV